MLFIDVCVVILMMLVCVCVCVRTTAGEDVRLCRVDCYTADVVCVGLEHVASLQRVVVEHSDLHVILRRTERERERERERDIQRERGQETEREDKRRRRERGQETEEREEKRRMNTEKGGNVLVPGKRSQKLYDACVCVCVC